MRSAFDLQVRHWLIPDPLQVWQEGWQVEKEQSPVMVIEYPVLHLQVPSVWRVAKDLQVMQPLAAVFWQVRHVLAQNWQTPLMSIAYPLLHRHDPSFWRAAFDLQARQVVLALPEQVEQVLWQKAQFPFVSMK